MYFKYKEGKINVKDCLICAILNVTPDSFSDGGKYYSVEKAVARAKLLIKEGCHMIDLGGESTRPGSKLVSAEEEIQRLVPVIKAIREFSNIPISIDTWKSQVADQTLEAGANIINDITGLLGDPLMAPTIAKHRAGALIMFNPVKARPDHPSSKKFPLFGDNPFSQTELEQFKDLDIVALMKVYFQKSLGLAKEAGITKDYIMLDPGIGFGLTVKENLQLLQKVDVIMDAGYMAYVGVSRKRFVVNLMEDIGINIDLRNENDLSKADMVSAFLTALMASRGVHAVRVHSVLEHKMAARVANGLRNPDYEKDIELGEYKND